MGRKRTGTHGFCLNPRGARDRRGMAGSAIPYLGPLPAGWSLLTAPTPPKRSQGQKWEMTAGGESTKVQLTTGGKAVSSNHCPGSRAESGFNQSGARSELQLQPAYGTNCSAEPMCSFSPTGCFSGSSEVPGSCCVPAQGRVFTLSQPPPRHRWGTTFSFYFFRPPAAGGSLWVPIYPFHFVPMRWHSDIIWKISNSPALLDQRKGRWLQFLRNHLRGFITGPAFAFNSPRARQAGGLITSSASSTSFVLNVLEHRRLEEGAWKMGSSLEVLMVQMRNLGNDLQSRSPKSTVRTIPLHCLSVSELLQNSLR